ncbi:MAG: ABC transporter permease [Bryobacteraceae bacterium]|nr:ABC transporter permease [Bryobacteraceae bacterium]
MAIPISYNIRNLTERKTTTVMTALGIALTVAVLLAALALAEGLRTSLAATGDPLHVLVMRKGATSELVSVVTREWFQDVRLRAGVARNDKGEPMASLEMVTIVILEGPEAPAGMNVNVRGLLPIGFEMRSDVKLLEGRMFEPGRREAVVGKAVARRYPGARLGSKIQFGRGDWEVVGIMDAGRSAANGEIFVDLNQIASDYNRSDALSAALLRARDEAGVQALINEIESDRRLNVTAVTERSYYQQQTGSAAPLLALGTFVSIIMAVGSCFAAMNTMYAAVSRRSAEIGTLRVLGFSRFGILTSFVIEALLLSLLGGALGMLLVLPLTNVTTGIGSFVTFSEISFNFHITPAIAAVGLGFALLVGLLGGLFPAASAARKEILDALRQA